MSTYRVHSDLLAQVADSEHEAREVRRILGAEQRKLTESDLDRRIADKADTWPCCCGACEQGRRVCPTPDACQLATYEPRPPMQAGDLLIVVALVLLSWAAIAATLLVFGVGL